MRIDRIKEISTETLAQSILVGLLRCNGSMTCCHEMLAIVIRELRGEPHPALVQSIMDALDVDEEDWEDADEAAERGD